MDNEKSNKVVSIKGGAIDGSVDLEITPEEVLLEALENLRSGEIEATHIAIIALDRGFDGEGYDLHIKNSLMRNSELVCLFEAAKTVMMRELL